MDAAELERGLLVAGYKVRQRVGAGATGTVYAAIDPGSGQKVALKVVHAHLLADEPAATRLHDELQRLVTLKHPGIVPVLAVGRLDGGQLYVISEFVQGQPLTDLLSRSGALAPEEARPLLEALALILAAAHGRGFVHGSLTPDNVWVTPQEDGAWPPMVRLMDFSRGAVHNGCLPGAALDAAPYYLAPAQCRGAAPSVAGDIYALGVIAYQLLTGRLPFSSATPAEVVRLQLEEEPRPPSSHVPVGAAVDQFVLRALHKDPEQRYQTMAQLRQALLALFGAAEPLADPSPPGAAAPAAMASGVILPARPRSLPPVHSSARDPAAATDRLPTIRGPARRPGTSPLVPALLGLVAAAAVGLGAYRGLAGHWPWTPVDPQPLEGRIVVTTTPTGATVRLNRVAQRGTTPLTLHGLQRGQPYEIEVQLAGYRPSRQTVALGLAEEERQLNVELSDGPPRWGTLHLRATQRADFFLDGRKVGTQTTGVTLAEVRSGVEHELRVVAPGFKPVRQPVRVESGKVQVLQFELERLTDSVE